MFKAWQKSLYGSLLLTAMAIITGWHLATAQATISSPGSLLQSGGSVQPCATLGVRAARTQPLGGNARNLSYGDFNGDGNADIVLLGRAARLGVGTEIVSVMVNDGKGKFAAPVAIEAGSAGTAVSQVGVTGDLNGDKLDDVVLVNANATNGIVTSLLGDATRLLRLKQQRSEPIPPSTIANVLLGQINGDAFPDLVYFGVDSVVVLPGLGDGNFGMAIVTRGLPQIYSPTLADLNRDNRTDVLWINNGNVSFQLGDGSGSFGAARALVTGAFANNLATGDLNRDGLPEVLYTAVREIHDSVATLVVMRNDGDLRFAQASAQTVYRGAGRIVIRDFNLDEVPDVVTINYTNGISFLTGIGNGQLRAPVHFSAGWVENGVGVADFNRDGKLDLVVQASNGANGTLVILDGTGTDFVAARDEYGWGSLLAGDFNNDGKSDLINNGSIRLSTVTGYAASVPVPQTLVGDDMQARDLNHDGKLDVVAQPNSAVLFFIGNGAGGFQPGPKLDLEYYFIGNTVTRRPYAVADFNRDGRDDIVIYGTDNEPTLYLQNNANSFTAAGRFGIGLKLNRFLSGDFNGDGFADVVATSMTLTSNGCNPGTTNLLFFAGNGAGAFAAPQSSALTLPAGLLYARDFNRDGRTDLAAIGVCTNPATASIALANAQGRFTVNQTFSFEGNFLSFALGDLNSDGLVDLLMATGPSYYGSNLYASLARASDGTFAAPVLLASTAVSWQLLITDVNGDGRADILAGNIVLPSTTPSLTTILNACGTMRELASVSAASYSATRVAPDSIVAAFGTGLATTTETARTRPLPTTLAGVSVRILDSTGIEYAAPLYFVSPTQVNYLMPATVVPGTARVTLTNSSGAVALGMVQVAASAPGLFAANANGQGVAAAVALRISATGAQTYEPVARFDTATNRYVPQPLNLSNATERVFLILYGTGWRGRSALSGVQSRIGGLTANVTYAGAQGEFIGLDQINVQLPSALRGRGEVELQISADGQAANPVRISVQ